MKNEPAPKLTVSAPHIVILLATYNGARFLDAQLASIAAQSFGQLDVIASDDGSSDGTPEMLAAWRDRWSRGRFEVREGPGKGFAENFRSLFGAAPADADFVACADQDDIWDADKLAAATAALDQAEAARPAVYFSRTRLIDETGADIGYSPLFGRPPGFRNAVFQSIGGGNTMVLNRPGVALVAESARRTGFVSHDWWAYLICSGAGGHVHYDPVPHIGYRQHAGNLVGRNTGMLARARRFTELLHGRFSRWTDENLLGLQHCADLLTPEARDLMQTIVEVRKRRGPAAMSMLRRSGVYRQTQAGNIGLAVAAFLGKL